MPSPQQAIYWFLSGCPVGVSVGVCVGASVGVCVGVMVGVCVGWRVGVAVAVGEGEGGKFAVASTSAGMTIFVICSTSGVGVESSLLIIPNTPIVIPTINANTARPPNTQSHTGTRRRSETGSTSDVTAGAAAGADGAADIIFSVLPRASEIVCSPAFFLSQAEIATPSP